MFKSCYGIFSYFCKNHFEIIFFQVKMFVLIQCFSYLALPKFWYHIQKVNRLKYEKNDWEHRINYKTSYTVSNYVVVSSWCEYFAVNCEIQPSVKVEKDEWLLNHDECYVQAKKTQSKAKQKLKSIELKIKYFSN